MLPDRVSNPGPLTYESGVLPIALRGPAIKIIDEGWEEWGDNRRGGRAGKTSFLFQKQKVYIYDDYSKLSWCSNTKGKHVLKRFRNITITVQIFYIECAIWLLLLLLLCCFTSTVNI